MLIVSKSVQYENMDTLVDLQSLKPGYGLVSQNGKYKLDYGLDGTLEIIGLETDKNGDIVMDKKTNTVKTKRIWDSRLKRVSNPEGALTLENGKFTVYDHKGDERIKPKGQEDESGKSKLVMQNNGLLALYNKVGDIVWSVPKRAPEGFDVNTDYDTKITQERNKLEEKTRNLVRLQSSENNSQMKWNILTNILWSVIALSLFYYLLTN